MLSCKEHRSLVCKIWTQKPWVILDFNFCFIYCQPCTRHLPFHLSSATGLLRQDMQGWYEKVIYVYEIALKIINCFINVKNYNQDPPKSWNLCLSLFDSNTEGSASSYILHMSQKGIVDKTLIRRNSFHLVTLNKSLKYYSASVVPFVLWA